jgi:transposase
MLDTQTDAGAGGASSEGRRPTVVAAPAPAPPEFFARPVRRTFTAKDKLRILALTDRVAKRTDAANSGQRAQAAGSGDIGAILRREGVYSSTLCDWRRQRDTGAFDALTPVRRGPKSAEANPLAAEVALLQRSNADLTRRLARAETIIDVQKKVAALLGLTPDGGGL